VPRPLTFDICKACMACIVRCINSTSAWLLMRSYEILGLSDDGLRRCERHTRVHAGHVGGVVQVAARVDAPCATGLRRRVAGGVGLELLPESIRLNLVVACVASHSDM